MRSVQLSREAIEDLTWLVTHERKLAIRLLKLLDEIAGDPFKGTGKPEPLRGELSGMWSRRIDQKHRVVYSVTDDSILVYACRGHYDG